MIHATKPQQYPINATQERINSILSQDKLTQDDRDYLQVLGTLVYDYEKQHEPMPKVQGIEILNSLVQDFEVKKPQDLLTIFGDESVINDICKGDRILTETETRKLNDYYVSHLL